MQSADVWRSARARRARAAVADVCLWASWIDVSRLLHPWWSTHYTDDVCGSRQCIPLDAALICVQGPSKLHTARPLLMCVHAGLASADADELIPYYSAGHTQLRGCVNESRGGRPGLPVPNSPEYGHCGRKAIQQHYTFCQQATAEGVSGWTGCPLTHIN